MITPVHQDGLVLFVLTKFAGHYQPFICWSADNAHYCRIDYGTI